MVESLGVPAKEQGVVTVEGDLYEVRRVWRIGVSRVISLTQPIRDHLAAAHQSYDDDLHYVGIRATSTGYDLVALTDEEVELQIVQESTDASELAEDHPAGGT